MKILHRYIFWEVLVSTLAAMLMFCLILVAGNVLRELIPMLADGRLSPKLFAMMIGLLIPFVFSFCLPLGVLTGVLMGIGRLSANREITAMKATGNGILQISLPILLIAAGGALLAVWTNNYLAPLSRTEFKNLRVNALREDPLRFFKTGVLSRDFPGYVFYLQDKQGSELTGLWLWELDKEDHPKLFIRADSGSLLYKREQDAIILTLRKGIAENWPEREVGDRRPSPLQEATIYFDELPIELPLAYSLGASKVDRDLSEHSLSELLTLYQNPPEEIDREDDPDKIRRNIKVTISNNFAMAASVFSFAFIAIPLAIKTGRKESYANAMLALGLGLVYYFFASMLASLDIPAALRPELLIWIPNLILISVGIYLVRRVYIH